MILLLILAFAFYLITIRRNMRSTAIAPFTALADSHTIAILFSLTPRDLASRLLGGSSHSGIELVRQAWSSPSMKLRGKTSRPTGVRIGHTAPARQCSVSSSFVPSAYALRRLDAKTLD